MNKRNGLSTRCFPYRRNGVKGGTLLKRFLNVYRVRGGKRIGMRIEGFAFTTVTRNTVIIRALPIGFQFKFEILKKDSSERKIKNHVGSKVLLFLVKTLIDFPLIL